VSIPNIAHSVNVTKIKISKPIIQSPEKVPITFFDKVLQGTMLEKPLLENNSAAVILNMIPARPDMPWF
jgi:hypothetical protein